MEGEGKGDSALPAWAVGSAAQDMGPEEPGTRDPWSAAEVAVYQTKSKLVLFCFFFMSVSSHRFFLSPSPGLADGFIVA